MPCIRPSTFGHKSLQAPAASCGSMSTHICVHGRARNKHVCSRCLTLVQWFFTRIYLSAAQPDAVAAHRPNERAFLLSAERGGGAAWPFPCKFLLITHCAHFVAADRMNTRWAGTGKSDSNKPIVAAASRGPVCCLVPHYQAFGTVRLAVHKTVARAPLSSTQFKPVVIRLKSTRCG